MQDVEVKQMPIHAVIFDLFDVLLHTGDLTERRSYEARIGLTNNGLERVMFRSPQFREARAGQVSETELWRDEHLFITAAQLLGMQVVQFKDARQAIAEIQACLDHEGDA